MKKKIQKLKELSTETPDKVGEVVGFFELFHPLLMWFQEWILHRRVKTGLPNRMFSRSIPFRMDRIGMRFSFYMKMKKELGPNISYFYWVWLNEEELLIWYHFTTIWNARNSDWWKPVHEDSPFSYVKFPSFGKHPVSQQMNISLSLSCSLYVVWKLLQGSNE